jgi:hypothetical protein
VRAGIERGREVGELRAVHVRDEMAAQEAGVEGRERGGRHDGPEIAAADADVDDVREALASRARAPAGVHRGDELRALPAHGENLVVQRSERRRQRVAGRHAQKRVQGGAMLGLIDRLAREQGVDARPQAARLG